MLLDYPYLTTLGYFYDGGLQRNWLVSDFRFHHSSSLSSSPSSSLF